VNCVDIFKLTVNCLEILYSSIVIRIWLNIMLKTRCISSLLKQCLKDSTDRWNSLLERHNLEEREIIQWFNDCVIDSGDLLVTIHDWRSLLEISYWDLLVMVVADAKMLFLFLKVHQRKFRIVIDVWISDWI